MLSSLAWLLAAALALLAAALVVLMPAYTLLLAAITILRAWRRHPPSDGSPWSNTSSSLFQGRVFHVRHRPAVHAFQYPLFFAVVDLDEASELFGTEPTKRGALWPLSTLMALRDADHLKNGEGLPGRDAGAGEGCNEISLRERIVNLVHERTEGRVDLRSDGRRRRRIHLVTHLMYYGYCFNPVSFYFILKPDANEDERTKNDAEDEEEIEAIVVEISNTPWNEMSTYVLHPQSVDMSECDVYPPSDPASSDMDAITHRYQWNKNFHVSPFMTMDHTYDWTFQWSRDRIKAQIKLIRRKDREPSSSHGDDNATTGYDATTSSDADDDGDAGLLYFTGGFDIRRHIRPTATYPLQLARAIARYPIYCFVIQLWIHYEALRLLVKGVAFVPHPEGSESGASRAIAAVMAPVFAMMGVAEAWWGRWKKGRGKKGKAA